jgi:beta-lactamase class D
MTLVCAAFVASSPAGASDAITVCTIAADPVTGVVLRQDGSCDTRVTPASTFKIAISLMGFDAGILKDEHTPARPFVEGYADWIKAWRQTTDPSRWMAYSVVWYSRFVTKSLGHERFSRYVHQFAYGNEDVVGDPGKDDGLTSAWLASSLKISPREQVAFLRKIVTEKLPVSPHAYEKTKVILDLGVRGDGWRVHGKTGSAPSRDESGNFAPGKPWGWFVGWAKKENRTVVFARLTRGAAPGTHAGPVARDALIRDLLSGEL